MTPERHDQVKRLFLAACELEGGRRTAFLDQACAEDPDLRAEVQSLLAHHSPATVIEGRPPMPGAEQLRALDHAPIAATSTTANGDTNVRVSRRERFAAGEVVAGRYRIIGPLGRGGMGEVYRAEDLRLEQPVALKFLSPGLTRNPSWVDRLHREVRLSHRVTNPNVCRVYDIGEANGEPFISMEYVDGEDLGSLLRRIGRLSRAKTVEISQQLCAGLAAAHRQGVLHRDLKPANIMIDGRGQARITDFGIATLAAPGGSDREVAGTLNYMAPELLDGKPASRKSDVYGLGAVLYEMVAGRPAFNADSLESRRSQASPPRPSSLADDVDPGMDRLIMRCLDPEPDNRPASVYEVAGALPGGGSLAVALAAGETPSPETVAAARVEGLRPSIAAVVFGCAILGLTGVVLLANRTFLIPAVGLPLASDVLRHKADEILQKLGPSQVSTDLSCGFIIDSNREGAPTQTSTGPHEPTSAVATTRPSLIFEYRLTPAPSPPDGPLSRSKPSTFGALPAGSRVVRLDPRGALRSYEAVPGRSIAAATLQKPPDFSTLFEMAGLSLDAFQAVTPRRRPPVFVDKSFAWDSVVAGRRSLPVHVEAGTLAEQINFFHASDSGSDLPADLAYIVESDQARTSARVKYVLFLIVVVGGVVLAWRNWRLGRGDVRGAWRLAAFMFCVEVVLWILQHPHKLDFVSEVGWGVVNLRFAIFAAVLICLCYVAAEPYVRRLWPHSMVSWSRILAGRFRDPVVGSDILIGGAVGVGVVLLRQVCVLLPDRMGELSSVLLLPEKGVELGMLVGFRHVLGGLVTCLAAAIWRGFVAVILMLLLRVTLRRAEPAFIAFILVATVVFTWTSDYPLSRPWFTFGLIVLGLAFLLTRIGVLAAMVSLFTTQMILNSPMTSDLTTWYAGSVGFALAVLVGMWVFGLYNAAAARPLR